MKLALMLDWVAFSALGVDVVFEIRRVALKLAFGEYLIIGIAHPFHFNSAIRVVFVRSCVIGLSLEGVLREDIVFIDLVVPGHFVWKRCFVADVVVRVIGIVVNLLQLERKDVVLHCLADQILWREVGSVILASEKFLFPLGSFA